MNESPPALETPTRPSLGKIIGGISFMLGWALLHVVLFYLFAVSGILVDVLLAIVKPIMFPGAVHSATGAHEALGWSATLEAGLVIAGAAGIPAGLAMFWSRRRRVLWCGFWVLLTIGVLCELSALYILVSNALTVPT
ncbi:MAG: hypothetical protein ACOYOF_13125 [Verrucomicrobiaceae bacterium]